MFGILEKMDNFSNGLMTEEQKIAFMQEIIDNGMVWQMHEKYIMQAGEYLGLGKCNIDLIEERYQAARLAGEC